MAKRLISLMAVLLMLCSVPLVLDSSSADDAQTVSDALLVDFGNGHTEWKDIVPGNTIEAMLANTLNIKPVMGSTDEGSIQQLGQARGMAKAMDKMVECMMAVTENPAEKIVAISHCAAPSTANMLMERVKKAAKFKDVFTIDTQGVSSLYAGPGGVIMVV